MEDEVFGTRIYRDFEGCGEVGLGVNLAYLQTRYRDAGIRVGFVSNSKEQEQRSTVLQYDYHVFRSIAGTIYNVIQIHFKAFDICTILRINTRWTNLSFYWSSMTCKYFFSSLFSLSVAGGRS